MLGASQAAVVAGGLGGYPVEKLIPLLRSDDDEIVTAGAFLAEELGAKAAPLMLDLTRLLGHRARWVRSDMLDAVLAAATIGDGRSIAQAVALVNDSEQTVRKRLLTSLLMPIGVSGGRVATCRRP